MIQIKLRLTFYGWYNNKVYGVYMLLFHVLNTQTIIIHLSVTYEYYAHTWRTSLTRQYVAVHWRDDRSMDWAHWASNSGGKSVHTEAGMTCGFSPENMMKVSCIDLYYGKWKRDIREINDCEHQMNPINKLESHKLWKVKESTQYECFHLIHWCSPEVIPKKIHDWCFRSQILVVFDSRCIIKHKATVQCIVIGKGNSHSKQAVHLTVAQIHSAQ